MAVEEVPLEAEIDLKSDTWSLQGHGAESEGRIGEKGIGGRECF